MKICKNKKAQSAMEYLMTYGWAILIVIIVAAALYALGVFNPATFTGRTATGFQTIGAPSDWDLKSNGDVKLKFSNSKMATALTIYTITTTLAGTETKYNVTISNIGPGSSIDIDLNASYVVENVTAIKTQTPGSTYSLKMAILYNAGGLDHTDTGTVTGTIG